LGITFIGSQWNTERLKVKGVCSGLEKEREGYECYELYEILRKAQSPNLQKKKAHMKHVRSISTCAFPFNSNKCLFVKVAELYVLFKLKTELVGGFDNESVSLV